MREQEKKHKDLTERNPPKVFLRFFRWFCHPELKSYIEGDLMELYHERLGQLGKGKADIQFIIDVLLLLKPGIIKRFSVQHSNYYDMYRNYFKVGTRNIVRNKGYAFINIIGLALGLALALLIGLWMWDELSHDKYHAHYDRIARVMQRQTSNGKIETSVSNPYVLSQEIRELYGSDFKYVLQSSWTEKHILTVNDKSLYKLGNYFEPEVLDMLSLKMLRGTQDALKDPYSIVLSESVAKSYFGDEDPINKVMRVDNEVDVKVTGVYEDLPNNSSFKDMTYIMPWKLCLITNPWITEIKNPWNSNFTQTFALLGDHADLEEASLKIKDVKKNRVSGEEIAFKPEVFLHPMSQWHLYSNFKNGVSAGGRIEFVWLFGIIGVFVLLLSCINFMNLSTARSERRAKEVGIRKAVGSQRNQLVGQFISESLITVVVAFLLAIALTQLSLPIFNTVAGKKINFPWIQPEFWLISLAFIFGTGLIAGSYPALYLSSFQPVKVLKGTFRVGRFASIPRKVLVVIQFTVSVTLIIGTIIVFRQIEHAKNRPLGYDQNGLIQMFIATNDIHDHFEMVRHELINSGAIQEMAESTSPPTGYWSYNSAFEWEGKDPDRAVDIANNSVTFGYGKTIGWQFVQGRDFSPAHASDSSAFVLNEAAVNFLGLSNPVGKIIKWGGKPYTIIGVVKDMVVNSPYEPAQPAFAHIAHEMQPNLVLKLNPEKSAGDALEKIEATFKKFSPGTPFEYEFVDQDYAWKFGDEERIGRLATTFASLAIFISCLGIFGLASFTAEQRTKEIGIRKVMGASVTTLWQMLSKDFMILVLISCLVAVPIAYYFLSQWLANYEYRTELSWWIFAVAGLSALLITLLTVSYQSVRAALANPVKSLRSE